ncbi:HTH-type transcriptional regulator/antitoxin MqsA [Rhizobium sp. SG_E_25_P2]|uniref:type II toxin-antitoxin system MqsA family antitoxin n=1 Tax=Rhizobium sp. SG_E_25_P2 TaxID=2879942 RepID=UPI0024753032|nr:type II toxin-antitoxin system MqsA family antitoxin [Rhizobium sp. SG_E_25_P2]MDH6267753.1 HTH-type transcriptional regulator/antitoxin MqsA [Rhizobium sp. SG_E_25_P2]
MPRPETMASPETGETLRRDVRPFIVRYRDREMTVPLPGYYPEGDDDGVHVGDDMAVVDQALEKLRREADGHFSPDQIRGLRQKLKLSQRKAGQIFGVGENAFDKYERGLISPSGPALKLMKLLDRDPDLLAELEARS